jgi:hypothetical protein
MFVLIILNSTHNLNQEIRQRKGPWIHGESACNPPERMSEKWPVKGISLFAVEEYRGSEHLTCTGRKMNLSSFWLEKHLRVRERRDRER